MEIKYLIIILLNKICYLQEMYSTKAIWTTRKSCHFRNTQRGRIRGEYCFWFAYTSQFSVQISLEVHVLNDCFHDEIRIGQGIKIRCELNRLQNLVGLILRQLFFLDQFTNTSFNSRFSRVKVLLFRFKGNDRLVLATTRGDLGNAVTHEAETHDAHLVEGQAWCS